MKINKNFKKYKIDKNFTFNDKNQEADLDIFFYLDGDNDLISYMDSHVIQLSKLAKNYKNINFIVLEDRGVLENNAWKNAKVFKVKSGKTLDEISREGKILNKGNYFKVSDPDNLSNFILTSLKKWKAKRFALVLSDHGGGFVGINLEKNPRGFMHLPELKKALQNVVKKLGKKFEFVLFDACFMGQIEVDYQLKDVANYILHTQDLEHGKGLEYDKIFKLNDLNHIEDELIENIDIDKDNISSFSLVKLTKNLDLLIDTLNEIGKIILNLDNKNKALVKKLILSSQDFGKEYIDDYKALYSDFKDIGDFLNKLKENKDKLPKDLINLTEKSLFLLNKVVIKNKYSKDKFKNISGLSIYMPHKFGYNNSYLFNYDKLQINNKLKEFKKAIIELFA